MSLDRFKEEYKVDENSSTEEIKKAYRRLAVSYHPDHHPEEQQKYTEIFKAIQERYEALLEIKEQQAKVVNTPTVTPTTAAHTSRSSTAAAWNIFQRNREKYDATATEDKAAEEVLRQSIELQNQFFKKLQDYDTSNEYKKFYKNHKNDVEKKFSNKRFQYIGLVPLELADLIFEKLNIFKEYQYKETSQYKNTDCDQLRYVSIGIVNDTLDSYRIDEKVIADIVEKLKNIIDNEKLKQANRPQKQDPFLHTEPPTKLSPNEVYIVRCKPFNDQHPYLIHIGTLSSSPLVISACISPTGKLPGQFGIEFDTIDRSAQWVAPETSSSDLPEGPVKIDDAILTALRSSPLVPGGDYTLISHDHKACPDKKFKKENSFIHDKLPDRRNQGDVYVVKNDESESTTNYTLYVCKSPEESIQIKAQIRPSSDPRFSTIEFDSPGVTVTRLPPNRNANRLPQGPIDFQRAFLAVLQASTLTSPGNYTLINRSVCFNTEFTKLPAVVPTLRR